MIQDSPREVGKILPHAASDKYVCGETLQSSWKFPDGHQKQFASRDSAEDDVPPEQHGGGKLRFGLLSIVKLIKTMYKFTCCKLIYV